MADVSRTTLAEKSRPACWAEVVGQDKAVACIKALIERDALKGRAYWISGPSGTGKTTIARLIAAEVADEFMVQEVDAPGLSPTATRKLENDVLAPAWGERDGRAIICNEAHMLRADVLEQLVVTLERVPPHVAWIFTTTKDVIGEYDESAPLLSRCLRLELSRRDLARPFAMRAKEIAEKEGLDGKPIESYIRLLQTHRNNFRAALHAIEAGQMLA